MSARVLRRAETLERAADLIEEDTTAMAKLIMQERERRWWTPLTRCASASTFRLRRAAPWRL